MTHTADDFRTARFATHPDGRRAIRLINSEDFMVLTGFGAVKYIGASKMADTDWSPLDETRLPRVVTDEMVDAAHRSLTGRHGYGRILRSGVEEAVTAALSAAPTTDDDARIGPETRSAYRDLHNPTTDEPEAPTITLHPSPNAGHVGVEVRHPAFGAYYAQVPAPATDEDSLLNRVWRDREESQALAEEMKARAEKAEWGLADLSERYREQGGALLRAEQERDEAIREGEELGEALDNVKPVDALTAREHLDAAWEAAHVPADGTIPTGEEFIARDRGNGRIYGYVIAQQCVPADGDLFERRLLDPPTRPDGAEAVEKALTDYALKHGGIRGQVDTMADFLAERGVRAPEDGEER